MKYLEKQRKKLDDYLRERDQKQRDEEDNERSHENKRLKIEKRKQEQLSSQKRMLQDYHEKRKETENLLRISNDKKPQKYNNSSPEFQFSNSYMKRRVKDSNSKGTS